MRRRGTVREKTGYRELPGRCEAEVQKLSELASEQHAERAGRAAGKRNAVCGYPQIGIAGFRRYRKMSAYG